MTGFSEQTLQNLEHMGIEASKSLHIYLQRSDNLFFEKVPTEVFNSVCEGKNEEYILNAVAIRQNRYGDGLDWYDVTLRNVTGSTLARVVDLLNSLGLNLIPAKQ